MIRHTKITNYFQVSFCSMRNWTKKNPKPTVFQQNLLTFASSFLVVNWQHFISLYCVSFVDSSITNSICFLLKKKSWLTSSCLMFSCIFIFSFKVANPSVKCFGVCKFPVALHKKNLKGLSPFYSFFFSLGVGGIFFIHKDLKKYSEQQKNNRTLCGSFIF